MNESIFSTYSTGENRITASIMAVLRCLALPRIDAILGALIQDREFELVRFENQPSAGGAGTPDAEIACNCRILLETKRVRNALDRDQLKRHLRRLKSSSEKVLVLTPDEDEPRVIGEINDKRLVWSNFAALNQAIDALLSDEKNDKEVLSEREQFLLRELQKMLLAEKELIGSLKQVLVIPARNAWPIYNNIHAYICQAGRAFRPVKNIAFYEGNKIQPIIPKVLGRHDHILFEPGQNTGPLGELVDRAVEVSERLDWPYKYKSRVGQVFLLSAPDVPETVRLPQPIENDITSSAGQRIAFTQNQRYVSLESLLKAKTTTDLETESSK